MILLVMNKMTGKIEAIIFDWVGTLYQFGGKGLFPYSETTPQITQKQPETPTGVFFQEQTVESLMNAVRFFEQHTNLFDPLSIRRNAEGFDRQIFKEKFKQHVENLYNKGLNGG